jgi:tubulin monoglycylase TTLL3/8
MVLNRVSKSLINTVKGILKDEFPFINPGEWLLLMKEPEKPKELATYE